MEQKSRVFKNETKIDQVFYDFNGNPILVKPGKTFSEDTRGRVDVMTLIRREEERIHVDMAADEVKRVRRVVAMIKTTKTLEDLEKFEAGETNVDVITAITERKKELINDSNNK